MKKLLTILFVLCSMAYSYSCPVCERNQPRILKGITHGQGPSSNWDYVIISGMIAISLIASYLSVKWMIQPGEKSEHHIKRTILNFE